MPDSPHIIKPADMLTLKVMSPLYRDIYKTEVLALQERSIKISMPSAHGKMALLSVGTPIEVTCPRIGYTFLSEVLERGFQPVPYLTIQVPFQVYSRLRQRPRVITITSGKGGVGKTTFTINFAIALAQMGQRVFIIDADLGTANVDVLLNLQPRYNLTHLISREKELLDIIVEGPGGIHLVPGGSGLQNLADMEEWQFNRVITSLQTLEQYADIILIDTGAGLGRNVINFVLAADNIIVVSTPEPHSVTDAYAMMKVLDERDLKVMPYLILNRVESLREYNDVSNKMIHVVNRFLNIKIVPLGYIYEDQTIPKANRRLEQFILQYPDTPAARCVKSIAERYLNPEQEVNRSQVTAGRGFFNKIRELFGR